MTVYAGGRVNQVVAQAASSIFNVSLIVWASDGTTDTDVGEVFVQVPFGSGSQKADRLVREGIAGHLSASFSLIIDPADIYIPFS